MHTNGNGNGSGRMRFEDWERRLWEAADPEMHATTMQAAHVEDDRTKGVLFRALAFIKRLRFLWQQTYDAVGNLYEHATRQQQEIRTLEDTVRGLTDRLELLAERERERSVQEALEGLDDSADMDSVFADLGRPEPATEGADDDPDA